jgi:putative FmdB family regulatory protein
MPFYDYRCTHCDTTVELLHGIDDETKRTHDGCGGALERQFSATSVHFKGSGWAKLERRESSGSTAAPPAPATPAQSSPSTPTPAAKPKAGGE